MKPTRQYSVAKLSSFHGQFAKIQLFCDAVAREFRPRKIILFGSHATGVATADSDVDLLVIQPRTRRKGERMSVCIRQAVARDFPLDLLVRTPAEIEKRLRWGDYFLREVMERGKVMYEAPDA
ncbi:MAG TPA: nucleotidyltransferase domain-containing protein [Opitutales bacterium]|nr:nucleotidyltransferase domain-containing protein [Opitutales bacterium]